MQAILQHFAQILSRVILALNSHIVVVAGYFAAKKRKTKKIDRLKTKCIKVVDQGQRHNICVPKVNKNLLLQLLHPGADNPTFQFIALDEKSNGHSYWTIQGMRPIIIS